MELSELRASLEVEIEEEEELLKSITFTETLDEERYYIELSKQLITLETTIEYQVDQVHLIREKVEKMFLRLDEKAELLMRCDWLEVMKGIEAQIPTITSLENVESAKRQLGRVQTCPLKNELKQKLGALEAKLTTVEKKEPSLKEILAEAIFATGNETFINLGSIGCNYVVEKVLKGDSKVETAIAKAEALEVSVQEAKWSSSTKVLGQALGELPLQHFENIPVEYVEEVLKNLLENTNWNGLFQLDLQIKHTVEQVHRKHNPVQQGVMTTLVMDEKLMEQLSVQKL